MKNKYLKKKKKNGENIDKLEKKLNNLINKQNNISKECDKYYCCLHFRIRNDENPYKENTQSYINYEIIRRKEIIKYLKTSLWEARFPLVHTTTLLLKLPVHIIREIIISKFYSFKNSTKIKQFNKKKFEKLPNNIKE